MHPHIIEEMVRRLRPVLKDRAEALKILNHYWADKMALVWDTASVHQAANELGLALTEGEAKQVLQALHLHYNRFIGLRYGDITAHVTENALGRNLTRREIRQFVRHNRLTIQR
jgi:hypothetical protein